MVLCSIWLPCKLNSKNNSSKDFTITTNHVTVCRTVNELKSIKKIYNEDLVSKLLLTSVVNDNFNQKKENNLVFPNENFRYIILLIVSLITSQIVLIFYNEVMKNFLQTKKRKK